MWGLRPLRFMHRPQTSDSLASLKRVDFCFSSYVKWAFGPGRGKRRCWTCSCWVSLGWRSWNRPSDTESNKFTSEQPHCPLHRFSASCQGFETLFFFLFSIIIFFPIVTVLCCRALNRTKTTVTGLPPLKVNVLKKTLLPKMLYCWMSQIMISCRSYVLWNHSQEMCVNTSSM